jgi:hypothetical protein
MTALLLLATAAFAQAPQPPIVIHGTPPAPSIELVQGRVEVAPPTAPALTPPTLVSRITADAHRLAEPVPR